MIVITGASSGIGTAIARACRGRPMLLVARRADRLAQVCTELPGAEALVLDLGASTAPATLSAAIAARGGCDALVNNAGIFAMRPVAEFDAEHVHDLISLDLVAPMLLTAAVLPHLRDGGTIINISSIAAEADFSGCAAYSAAKAGLEAFSRSLRQELRPRRIRVSVVAPGPTDTEVWPADHRPPAHRLCRAEDVAAAVRLCLDASPSASIDRIAVMPALGPLDAV